LQAQSGNSRRLHSEAPGDTSELIAAVHMFHVEHLPGLRLASDSSDQGPIQAGPQYAQVRNGAALRAPGDRLTTRQRWIHGARRLRDSVASRD
jgi:hypothetical protein